jgi:hypothetical protein
MLRHEGVNPCRPILLPAGEITTEGAAPEKPIAVVKINPVDLMPQVTQSFRNLGKKRRCRTLQEQKSACRALSEACLQHIKRPSILQP